MSLQEVLRDENCELRPKGLQHIYPTRSGDEGAFIASGSNVAVWVLDETIAVGSTSPNDYQVICAVASDEAATDSYDPEMVARLLRLDAQAPEAKFDNVVDMLDWLNSD